MKEQKGITLIALIITIIVMLILVAVTINIALNGGIFTKAKDATLKTEIAQIQEQLLIAKAEKMAENNGAEPDDYDLTLSSLNIPDSLKTKYQNKLEISADGKLNYVESEITAEEIAYFQEIGIAKKTEEMPAQEVEITHPSIEEGTIWSNVSLAQQLVLPEEHASSWIITLSNTISLEYGNKLIETTDGKGKIPGFGIWMGDYGYFYSWESCEAQVADVPMNVSVGWNSIGDNVPDIVGVTLSGTVSWDDPTSIQTYAENWFIQN